MSESPMKSQKGDGNQPVFKYSTLMFIIREIVCNRKAEFYPLTKLSCLTVMEVLDPNNDINQGQLVVLNKTRKCHPQYNSLYYMARFVSGQDEPNPVQ